MTSWNIFQTNFKIFMYLIKISAKTRAWCPSKVDSTGKCLSRKGEQDLALSFLWFAKQKLYIFQTLSHTHVMELCITLNLRIIQLPVKLFCTWRTYSLPKVNYWQFLHDILISEKTNSYFTVKKNRKDFPLSFVKEKIPKGEYPRLPKA